MGESSLYAIVEGPNATRSVGLLATEGTTWTYQSDETGNADGAAPAPVIGPPEQGAQALRFEPRNADHLLTSVRPTKTQPCP